MKLSPDAYAVFKKRPNRFLPIVDIYYPYKKKNVEVHVHDPGRLTELLYEGNKVSLKKTENRNGKTKWDLISARNADGEVLIHSGYHQKLVLNFFKKKSDVFFDNIKKIKTEPAYKKSRVDFCQIKANLVRNLTREFPHNQFKINFLKNQYTKLGKKC